MEEPLLGSEGKILSKFEANSLRVLAGGVGIAAIGFILTWAIFVRDNPSESKDKLLALATGLSVLIFGLRALKANQKFKKSEWLAIAGIVSVFAGILIIENKPMSKEHPMGFGPIAFSLAVAILLFIPYWVEKSIHSRTWRIALWPIAIFISLSVLLAFVQWNGTLVESGHSEYVVNEILARGTGYVPYRDFIPQYSYLLSWLFAPFVSNLNAEQAMQLIVITLSLGSIFCLALVIWLGKRAFPKMPIVLLIVIMIPFTTPTPGWNRSSFSGPISTLLSGPSIRVLGGFVVGLTLYLYLTGFVTGRRGTKFGIFAGSVAALVAWNNFDFGIAALVSSIFVLSLFTLTSKVNYWIYLKAYLLGMLACSSLLFLAFAVLGGLPRFEFLGWFSRQFGGGFGSVTISVPGPVLVNFPMIFGIATLGVYALIFVARSKKDSELVAKKLDASVLTTFFGVWSILCLPYYLNRSYQAGQMSIQYIGLSVALIGAISLTYGAWRERKREWIFARTLASSLVAFAISTIVVIPNVTMEWDRLNGGNSNGTLPRPWLQNVIANLDTVETFAKSESLSLAYYGESGHYVKKKFDIPSANLFNNPLDMFQSDAAVQVACRHLAEKGFQLLIMTETGKQTFAWQDGSLCEGLYTIIQSGEGVYLARVRS